MPRWDDIGLWWEDIPTTRGSKADRPRPNVPETGWKHPTEFPNLSAAHILSFDTETYDPNLQTSGPGWGRKDGHIVGVSIGAKARDGTIGQWYFPLRHEDTPEENMEVDPVIRFLKSTLEDQRPKVGAHLIYDVGWLAEEGINVQGKLLDVQHAEALLTETGNVALETLAQKYLNEGKETSLLYKWCADYYGGKANSGQRKNIYRSPPSLAGPYAESDASLPLRILDKQWPLLWRDGLYNLFDMECRLIPLLVAMRQQGVPVDLDYAEQFYEEMGRDREPLIGRLKDMVGFEVNVNSKDDLKRAFDMHGIKYPYTKKGAPSFKADFLDTVDHPIGKEIVGIRRYDKLRNVFLKSYILENHVNGIVHCSFNQLRGEEKGTRSGRFSSSDPNLQNIPVRTELGKRIRRAFAHKTLPWRKYDYSQIEYRFFAHYAEGPGADEMRARYQEDPDTDYHEETKQKVLAITGQDLKRGHVKNVNFGLLYGQGEPGLAALLGLPLSEARKLFKSYHEGVPFTKVTMEATKAEIRELGYITTIMGRRSYFDKWEPADWRDKRPALYYDDAVATYGTNIVRAYLNPGLNRRLQGSAADMMKKAMVDIWESGVLKETGVPSLTVHDELDWIDPGGVDKQFDWIKEMMENAMQLRVPIRADYEIGPNWGDVKEPA